MIRTRGFFGFTVIALSAFVLTMMMVIVSCDNSVDIVVEERHHEKRGVGFSFNLTDNPPRPPGLGALDAAWLHMNLLAPGVGWFYNWGHYLPAHVGGPALQHNIVFIPQLWNANWDPNVLRSRVAEWRAAGHTVRYLMTYNEPMLTNEANMTPEAAAADWRRLVPIARELNLRLVSPAMTFGNMPGFGTPWVWLQAFFDQPGVYIEDMHAIRIHTYMSHPTAVKGYVENFTSRWDLPIWVTEFSAWYYVPAPAGVSNSTGTVAQGQQYQIDFMSEVLVYLELNPRIEKYFWFMPISGYVGSLNDRHPFHNLIYNTNPPTLTPLGVVYVNMPNFDRTRWIPAGEFMIARDITNANTSQGILSGGGNTFSHPVRFRPSTDPEPLRAPLDIHHLSPNPIGTWPNLMSPAVQNGRWIEFQVDVPAGGTSRLSIRNVAPEGGTLYIGVRSQGSDNLSWFPSVDFSQSFGWRTTAVDLPMWPGRQTIRLQVPQGNLAINWLMLHD